MRHAGKRALPGSAVFTAGCRHDVPGVVAPPASAAARCVRFGGEAHFCVCVGNGAQEAGEFWAAVGPAGALEV